MYNSGVASGTWVKQSLEQKYASSMCVSLLFVSYKGVYDIVYGDP